MGALQEPSDDVIIDRITRRLADEFADREEDAIQVVVRHSLERKRNARIHTFLAVFVEREARDELRRAG